MFTGQSKELSDRGLFDQNVPGAGPVSVGSGFLHTGHPVGLAGFQVVVVAHPATASGGLESATIEVDRATGFRGLNVGDPRGTVVVRARALLDVLKNAHPVTQ